MHDLWTRIRAPPPKNTIEMYMLLFFIEFDMFWDFGNRTKIAKSVSITNYFETSCWFIFASCSHHFGIIFRHLFGIDIGIDFRMRFLCISCQKWLPKCLKHLGGFGVKGCPKYSEKANLQLMMFGRLCNDFD